MNIKLTPEERFEVFGDFDPDAHAAEAQERWGGSEAYEQSRVRVSSYDKRAWLQIKREGEEIERAFVVALTDGTAPDAAAAMDLAEEHRRHISRWFYDCTYEMHARLAQMYVDDARFAVRYEAIARGLAAYIRDAAAANARRATA